MPIGALLLFALVGPGVELGVGPYVLTQFEQGDWLPDADLVWMLGALLLFAALSVDFEAFRDFGRAGGTPSPMAPPPRPVTGGVYALVDHPMYVATVVGLIGEALILHQSILLIAAGAYAVTMTCVVVFIEEPRLRQRFGGKRWRDTASSGEGDRPRGEV